MFAELLETPGGPFKDAHLPMIDSIRSLAQLLTARALRKRNLPASYLDPDEVAHEALLVFFCRYHTIQKVQSLRPWFWSIMSRRLLHLLDETRSGSTPI